MLRQCPSAPAHSSAYYRGFLLSQRRIAHIYTWSHGLQLDGLRFENGVGTYPANKMQVRAKSARRRFCSLARQSPHPGIPPPTNTTHTLHRTVHVVSLSRRSVEKAHGRDQGRPPKTADADQKSGRNPGVSCNARCIKHDQSAAPVRRRRVPRDSGR